MDARTGATSRTGANSRTVDLPDSLMRAVIPLPDGWAWVPASADRIIVRRGEKTLEFPKPEWFIALHMLDFDAASQRLLCSAGPFARHPGRGRRTDRWDREPLR